ncbi:hypothetical protein ABV409_02875 [Flagellimonas sp. DF-77]|uniref:hypothetical protein n=1 Tax=Flagellimonas algarum TaxID=3230298 RepID=UPI0033928E40
MGSVVTTPLNAQEFEVHSIGTEFYGNGSVAVAHDGTVYVNQYGTATADIMGSGTKVFALHQNGEIEVLFENEVRGPVGGTFDAKGTYFFNQKNSYTRSEFMQYKNGALQKIADLDGFSGDVLLDRSSTYFLIPSYTHAALRKVTFDGSVEDIVQDDRLKGCTGITYGLEGDIFLSNFSTGKILRIDNEWQLSEFASIPITYPGYVVGYLEFFEGQFYATGYGSNKIYRIDEHGGVHEFAGSGELGHKDGPLSEAGFITPNGIAIDAAKGRLYISQNGNGKAAPLRYIDLR